MTHTGRSLLISQTNSDKNYGKSNSDIVVGIAITLTRLLTNRHRYRRRCHCSRLAMSRRLGKTRRHSAVATTFLFSGRQTSSKAQPVFEKDPLALDVCGPVHKKIAQLRRVVITIVKRIETEKHFATGSEVMLQIAQKKIPFRRFPPLFCGMVQVKVCRERSDPIEFLAEIRQRLERADGVNHARHSEQLLQLAK